MTSSALVASSSRQKVTTPMSCPISGCILHEAIAPKPRNVSNSFESENVGGKLETTLGVADGGGQLGGGEVEDGGTGSK